MTLVRSIKLATLAALLAGTGTLTTPQAGAWPWPAVNPEIYNSGHQFRGAYYDPFTGRFVVRTDRTRVRESALDPWRNQVDPGSRHYVDYVQVDGNGNKWRVRGWKWTSNGVPHGDVRRTRVGGTGIPGVDHEQNDRVVYSTRTGGNQNRGSGAFLTEPGRGPVGAQPPIRLPVNRFHRPRRLVKPQRSRGYNPF